MKNVITIILLILSIHVCISAQERSSTDVHVKGYYKSNGTYVAPHMRTAPNKTRGDNFSTRGNTNPYTFEYGTQGLKTTKYSKKSSNGGVLLFLFILCILFYLLYRLIQRPVRKSYQNHEIRKHTEQSKVQNKSRPKGNCPKCNGVGHIPRFSHINNGKCYQCNGSGFITKNRSFSGNQYPSDHFYEEDDYVIGITDVFDRDEICDPDLLENWDEEYRSRKFS